MRILGIDPGTKFAGWGIIENTKYVDSGVFTAPGGWKMERRLQDIIRQFAELLDCNAIDLVAIENPYCGKFPQAALSLGQAVGAFLAVSWSRGLEVEKYSPKEVKMAVYGGGASKSNVAVMVSAILGLPLIQESDRADALAVALCCEARLCLQNR